MEDDLKQTHKNHTSFKTDDMELQLSVFIYYNQNNFSWHNCFLKPHYYHGLNLITTKHHGRHCKQQNMLSISWERCFRYVHSMTGHYTKLVEDVFLHAQVWYLFLLWHLWKANPSTPPVKPSWCTAFLLNFKEYSKSFLRKVKLYTFPRGNKLLTFYIIHFNYRLLTLF